MVSTEIAASPSAKLDHQAYIWQRQWTPAVSAAIDHVKPDLSGLRVLALQFDPIRGWTSPSAIHFTAFRDVPVVLVVRLEQLPAGDGQGETLNQLMALLSRWRAGTSEVRGLEIDFDSATSQLARYAEFLMELRARMPKGYPLSITVLPTWIESKAFPALAQSVDLLVLQVHAIQRPPAPLFEPNHAWQWIARLQRATEKPFLLALPTYGSRVHFDVDHSIIAVESEQKLGSLGAAGTSEQYAAAPVLFAFVRELEDRAPAGLTGVAWFRLPTTRDQRAWSAQTLLAVIRGTPLESKVQSELRQSAADSFDVLLHNTGNMDGELPHRVRLHAECRAGDGARTFEFDLQAKHFLRSSAASLPAGRRIVVGWVRCVALEGSDVELVW
jgi:hypothetical protein